MDVYLLQENSIKLRGKKSGLIINPTTALNKNQAEGVIKLSEYTNFSDEKVEEKRILINGMGEYEVGGIKISTIRVGDKLVGFLEIDGIKVLVGSGAMVEKISDKVEGGEMAIINADEPFNYSVLSTIEPSVLIVYGDLKDEVSKKMGKNDVASVSKFSVTSERLPEEMQYVTLG